MKRFLLKPYHILKARSKHRQVDDETLVLAVLDSEDEFYGYDLHKKTGLRARRMYRTLSRLEAAGMLNVEWENHNPPRKYIRRLYKHIRKARRRELYD